MGIFQAELVSQGAKLPGKSANFSPLIPVLPQEMPQFSLGKDISELCPWWFIPGVVSGLVHPTQSSRVSRCNVQLYVFAYNPQTLNRL